MHIYSGRNKGYFFVPMNYSQSQEIPMLIDQDSDKEIIILGNARASTDKRRGAAGSSSHGPVIFLEEIKVYPPYLKFRRENIPGVVFHLGTEIAGAPESITVPAGTKYKIESNIPGADIIQVTQVDQNFFFDYGTKFIIPKNLPFHIGNETECFCKDTKVYFC